MQIVLSEAEYRDKVYACWLGKNIGGTLGVPMEGKRELHNLTFFDPMPSESSANDDLDLQLIWLKMLQERGVNPSLSDFAEYWVRYASSYPWGEYGFCRRNLGRGLMPPISGMFENYWIDEMGSPIRSEIWACIAPGNPQRAAAMAWKDSQMDHAGGEGAYGEMFWAALESAAFVIQDPMTLIQIGLAMIPHWSRISRAVREAVWSYENNVEWEEARNRIVHNFGSMQPCQAPQNHAFTIIGWLYGKDYGDKLCKAVNCGYDTDCTGATLGSLLGILGGTAGIPEKWRAPIGEGIVLHPFTRGLDAPRNVAELTEQTVALAHQVMAQYPGCVAFGAATQLPEGVIEQLFRADLAEEALQRDVQAATLRVQDVEVTLHYNGEPVLRPGISKVLGVSLERDGKPVEGKISLQAPAAWSVEPADSKLGQTRFRVRAASVADKNTVTVTAVLSGSERKASFTVLGPGEAKGYQAGIGVPCCPKCHARAEACICDK